MTGDTMTATGGRRRGTMTAMRGTTTATGDTMTGGSTTSRGSTTMGSTTMATGRTTAVTGGMTTAMGSRATGGTTTAMSGTTTRQNEGDGRHDDGDGQQGNRRHWAARQLQNLLLLHPGQVDLQVLPWGACCSRVKACRTLSIVNRGFRPCSLHLDFRYVLFNFTYGNPYHLNHLVKLYMHKYAFILTYLKSSLAFDT